MTDAVLVSRIAPLRHLAWTDEPSAAALGRAVSALETGGVLFLPDLRFEVARSELNVFSPAIAGSAKNVGFDPATGRIGGTVLGGDDLRALTDMLARFSRQASALVGRLPLPGSGAIVRLRRTRPGLYVGSSRGPTWAVRWPRDPR